MPIRAMRQPPFASPSLSPARAPDSMQHNRQFTFSASPRSSVSNEQPPAHGTAPPDTERRVPSKGRQQNKTNEQTGNSLFLPPHITHSPFTVLAPPPPSRDLEYPGLPSAHVRPLSPCPVVTSNISLHCSATPSNRNFFPRPRTHCNPFSNPAIITCHRHQHQLHPNAIAFCNLPAPIHNPHSPSILLSSSP